MALRQTTQTILRRSPGLLMMPTSKLGTFRTLLPHSRAFLLGTKVFDIFQERAKANSAMNYLQSTAQPTWSGPHSGMVSTTESRPLVSSSKSTLPMLLSSSQTIPPTGSPLLKSPCRLLLPKFMCVLHPLIRAPMCHSSMPSSCGSSVHECILRHVKVI